MRRRFNPGNSRGRRLDVLNGAVPGLVRGPLRLLRRFSRACGGDASTGTIEGTVTPANALPTVLALADGDVIAVARPNVTTGAFRVDVLTDSVVKVR